MLPFFKKKRKRACVVGLDGVPHSLLVRLAEQGTMPSLAGLFEHGNLHRMKVTLPEISSVSWTSFMTGVGPGTHGIFGFIDLKPKSREMRFPGFRDVKAPTLWDRLGKSGKRCVVLNQPSTYPARPIPGILVSGFVAVDLRKAVHPPEILQALERMHYELDIDTARARKNHDYLFQALYSSLEARQKAVDHFWMDEDWDYFQVVITGTDRLQHYLWNAIEDPSDPRHGDALNYYGQVDRFLARIIERFRETNDGDDGLSRFLLLSDHGFTRIKREFNLNTWLCQAGYQSLSEGGAPSLERLCEHTKAFALEPNRVYFNRKDRFHDGCVDPGDVPRLSGEIAEGLSSLRFEGEPVVKRVIQRDEIYQGPWTHLGPDLIVLTHYGFDAKGALGRSELLQETDLQGMHTWDDAFLWTEERLGEDVNIVEIAPVIESMLTKRGR